MEKNDYYIFKFPYCFIIKKKFYSCRFAVFCSKFSVNHIKLFFVGKLIIYLI